jgi:hypothetical protein
VLLKQDYFKLTSLAMKKKHESLLKGLHLNNFYIGSKKVLEMVSILTNMSSNFHQIIQTLVDWAFSALFYT